MKRVRFIAVIIAIFVTTTSLNLSKNINAVTSVFSDINFWSALTTVKVMQEVANTVDIKKDTKTLSAEAAKGETTDAQLIITPKKEIREYNVKISDLKTSNGNVFSKNNISIFMERYIEVGIKSNSALQYPSGFYPDAIVPFDKAAAVGENTIAANTNQGIWFTIKVPKSQAAGVYDGNVTVEIGNQSQNIPISIRIYNFTIPEEIKIKSAYYVRQDWLTSGELDSSDEMYKKYYDFLLDYGVSATNIPTNNPDPVEYAKTVKSYVQDPRVSAYNIMHKIIFKYIDDAPTDSYQRYGAPRSSAQTYGRTIFTLDFDYLKSVIKELARQSTSSLNLLKKAYLYFNDEPYVTGSTWEVGYTKAQIEKVLPEIISELKAEDPSFFAKREAGLEDTIRNFKSLVTTHIIDQVDGYVDIWCPTINNYDSPTERAKYEARKNAGNELWSYTCWIPQNPHPSLHIDDSLLGSRVMRWMMMDYGIEGDLYWGAANYMSVVGDRTLPRAPYDDPLTFLSGGAHPNADGYVLYPGVNYGINGPVSSIRLENIRDGINDYQYLWLLKDLVSKAQTYYNKDLGFSSIMSSLYASLYSGTVYDANPDKLVAARNEIASLIELISVDSKSIVTIDSIDQTGINPMGTVSVYAANGYTVTVDGVTPVVTNAGNGKKFTFKIALNNAKNYFVATISNGTKSYSVNKFVSTKSVSINNFTSPSQVSKWTSTDSSVTIASNPVNFAGNNAMKVTFTNNGDLMPTDSIGIKTTKQQSFADINFANLDAFEFEVYLEGTMKENTSQGGITLYIELIGANSKRIILSVVATPNKWTKVKIGQLYNSTWEDISNVTAMNIYTLNDDVAQMINDTGTVYFANMFCTLAK